MYILGCSFCCCDLNAALVNLRSPVPSSSFLPASLPLSSFESLSAADSSLLFSVVSLSLFLVRRAIESWTVLPLAAGCVEVTPLPEELPLLPVLCEVLLTAVDCVVLVADGEEDDGSCCCS